MWVKVDDRFHQNPKASRIGAHARDLYIAGLEYCNRNLTDGFIPRTAVRTLVPMRPTVIGWLMFHWQITRWKALQRERLWLPVVQDGIDGFQVNDFATYQPTRQDVIERRDAEKKRSAGKRRQKPNSETPPALPDIASSRTDLLNSTPIPYANVGCNADRVRKTSANVDLPVPVPEPVPVEDRTPSVVLLSDHLATSTQKLPPREKRAPAESPPRSPNDADTSTPVFLRPSPEFAPADVRDHAGGPDARAGGLDGGGREGRDQDAHGTVGVSVAANAATEPGARPGGGCAREDAPDPSIPERMQRFINQFRAVKGHTS